MRIGTKRPRADILIYRHDAERVQENIIAIVESKREEILPTDKDSGVGQLKRLHGCLRVLSVRSVGWE